MGLLALGCQGPAPRGLELQAGKTRRDPECYVVTAILRNDRPKALALDEISIAMTAFDADGQVLSDEYPFSFDGQVRPLASTRLPLAHPDPQRRIDRVKLALKDSRGRTLQEVDVPSDRPGARTQESPLRSPRPAIGPPIRIGTDNDRLPLSER